MMLGLRCATIASAFAMLLTLLTLPVTADDAREHANGSAAHAPATPAHAANNVREPREAPVVDWEEGGIRVAELPASHALLQGELMHSSAVPISIFHGTLPKTRTRPELAFYLWVAHSEPPTFDEDGCTSDALIAQLFLAGTAHGTNAPWATRDVEYSLCRAANGSTTLTFEGEPDRDLQNWGKVRLLNSTVIQRRARTREPLIPPVFLPRLIPWKEYDAMKDVVGQYPRPTGYVYAGRPKWWLTILGMSLLTAGYTAPILSDVVDGGVSKERRVVYIPLAGAFARWDAEAFPGCDLCHDGPSGVLETFLYFFPGLVQLSGVTLSTIGLLSREKYWVRQRSVNTALTLQPLAVAGLGSGLSAQLRF